MPAYLLRVRDCKNNILLDRWTECYDAAEALAQAHGTIRSLVGRDECRIDPRGRVDVEAEGRPVARLLIAEELKLL